LSRAQQERAASRLCSTLGALDVVRTPERFERHNGLAAYDAWAEHLLRDARGWLFHSLQTGIPALLFRKSPCFAGKTNQE